MLPTPTKDILGWTVMLPGTGEWELQMELRFKISWSWDEEIILDYSYELSVITRILKNGSEQQKTQCQGDVMWDRFHWPLLALKMKERGHEPKNQATERRQKSQENRFSLIAFRKEHSPADTLVLALWCLCWAFDIQNCLIIGLYSFKPLMLW